MRSGISPTRSAIAHPGAGHMSRWPRRRALPVRYRQYPGVVEAEGRTNLHALPRIAWDGRQRSLRAMRVMLSGAAFAAQAAPAIECLRHLAATSS